MDLQFNQNVVKCLQCTAREYQTQEQTQELRIPDGMPDIGIVLACWGQVVLRGKEWRSDCVGISGGVMAKVLYLPEESDIPQVVEAWLPFQMKWTMSGETQDGTIQVIPGIRGADARVLSARKLMVRTNIGVVMQTMSPAEFTVHQPENLPEDVHLLTEKFQFLLPKEAGEKAFNLDEMLELPASEPKPEQVIRVSLSPQVLEQKVLADKLIFRGLCIVRLLYRTGEGQLCSRDWDVPFSQYADLGQEFDPEAIMQVIPVVTNLELEQTADGALHLKAGLSGQYIVYDRVSVDVPMDAYSHLRSVKPMVDQLEIPAGNESAGRSVTAQADPHIDVMRPVDVTFWPEQPYIGWDGAIAEADLGGTFQMLYYDPDGQLQSSQLRWSDTLTLDIPEGAGLHGTLQLSGRAGYSAGMLSADLTLELSSATCETMEMLTGLELGECREPDPMRPSVVLIKAGRNTLWEIAKDNGSTVEMIQTANHITDVPKADTVLLIPVL